MHFPVVDSVTPDHGPLAGGTSVTIVGRNFTGTTSVTFDGLAAASFSVDDDNTITAVTPAGMSPGPIDVVLVNADGTSDGAVILNDSSGNGHDGGYSAPGDPSFAAGLVAGGDALTSFALDTARYFEVADPIIDPGSAFSVEYWASSAGGAEVNLNAQSVDAAMVMAGPALNGSNDGIVRTSVAGVGNWDAIFNSETLLPQPQFPFPLDGDAHHLVLVYEPTGGTTGVQTLYIDGSFIESVTTSGTPGGAGAGTPMSIVASRLVFTGPHDGATMDELAFYPSALSGGAVSAHFAAASSSYADYAAAVLADSPTAYYRFDDDRKNGGFTFDGPPAWYVGVIAMSG